MGERCIVDITTSDRTKKLFDKPFCEGGQWIDCLLTIFLEINLKPKIIKKALK